MNHPAAAAQASRSEETPSAFSRADLPAIGADFLGGKFAGISIENGHPVALILLPGDVEKNWKDAKAWAQEQGADLPSRFDAIVLFENLRDEFQHSYYWTKAEHADDSAYAWGQSFNRGDQCDWHKGDKTRARSVRRVPIR